MVYGDDILVLPLKSVTMLLCLISFLTGLIAYFFEGIFECCCYCEMASLPLATTSALRVRRAFPLVLPAPEAGVLKVDVEALFPPTAIALPGFFNDSIILN